MCEFRSKPDPDDAGKTKCEARGDEWSWKCQKRTGDAERSDSVRALAQCSRVHSLTLGFLGIPKVPWRKLKNPKVPILRSPELDSRIESEKSD